VKEERLVFLVHGLWRTRFSMLRMQVWLERAGFSCVNRTYRTTKKSIHEHADDLAEWVEKTLAARRANEAHFVTHSMGGLVVRHYLSRNRLSLPGRLVMLAPPNQGAEKVEMFRGVALFRLFLGPHAERDLGKGEGAAFRDCGVPDREFGIIAGGTGTARGFSPFLAGDNDGTVLVEETRLEGAKDFLLVPLRHTFIMNGRQVIEATIRFLETGRFSVIPQRGEAATKPGHAHGAALGMVDG